MNRLGWQHLKSNTGKRQFDDLVAKGFPEVQAYLHSLPEGRRAMLLSLFEGVDEAKSMSTLNALIDVVEAIKNCERVIDRKEVY